MWQGFLRANQLLLLVFTLKLVLFTQQGLFGQSSAAQKPKPVPPVSVVYDGKALQELIKTPLGRVIYEKARAQIADVIREKVAIAEFDESGGPRIVKDVAKIRVLESWLTEPVHPETGTPENEMGPVQNPAVISRQDYYLKKIEATLKAAAGPTRSKNKWIEDSMINWRLIFDELRGATMFIAYDLEVLPNFQSIDNLIGDPSHVPATQSRPMDALHAQLVGRLNPRVRVNSIGGYVELGDFTYSLPLFPEYNQVWKFPEITGEMDLAASVDLKNAKPFEARFGPLKTNLGEKFDKDGNKIWNGIEVPKLDVDYFMEELLTVERFQDIVSGFYTPEGWDEEEASRSPFRELPTARKLQAQGMSDVSNILAKKFLKVFAWLVKDKNGEIDVEFGVAEDPATVERMELAKKSNALIVSFETDLPLEAKPTLTFNPESMMADLKLNIPNEMDLVLKIKELHFPKFLFKDAKNEIVQKILGSLPDSNMVGPDASIKLSIKKSDLLPHEMGPPAPLDLPEIQLKLPYKYMKPSEWRVQFYTELVEELNQFVGPLEINEEGQSPLTLAHAELEKAKAKLKDSGDKEHPVPVLNEKNFQPDLRGMSSYYLNQVELRFDPGIDPIVIRPFDERSLPGQLYDQMPTLVRSVRAVVPKITLKTMETSIADRLQEKIGSLKGSVKNVGASLDYALTDFNFPKDAVGIDWFGDVNPRVDFELFDWRQLSTSYESLYKLNPKHVVATTIKLPSEFGISLRNIKSSEADVGGIDVTVKSSLDEPTVTVQWIIVEDAAGELHTLPYRWNLPTVFESFKPDLKTLKYWNLEPKVGAGSYTDPVADFTEGVGAVGGLIDILGPEVTRRALRQTWVGRRFDDVAGGLIGWGIDMEAKAVEAVAGGGASLYRSKIERPEVEATIVKKFASEAPGIIDTIAEEMVKNVNGELKPNLPMDEEAIERRELFFDALRLLDPARTAVVEKIVETVDPSEPTPSKPRDPDAPMPALQTAFQDIFEKIEESVPIRSHFSQWKVGGNALVPWAESQAKDFLSSGVNGKLSFWPPELTNSRIVKAFEEDAYPAIRKQIAELPKDNKDTVENILNPQALIGDKMNEAVNELVVKQMRGEKSPDAPAEEPPPIPPPPASFTMNFPELLCPGTPIDISGQTDDDLILLHIFQAEDRDQVPPRLISENPIADIQKNISNILYPFSPNVRDLSNEGQINRNRRDGNDPEHRTAAGAAILNLDSLLKDNIQPNIEKIVKDLRDKIVKDQDLANESLTVNVADVSLDVQKDEDGRNRLVVGFDLDIKQKGAGKKGIVKFLASLFGISIDTAGKQVGDSPTGPLRVTWPMSVGLSNNFNERPETENSPKRTGHSVYLQSEFPIRVEGPMASRSWETVKLMEGPLLDALRDFKFSQSFDGAQIPELQDYTELQIEYPRMLPGGVRGFAVVPMTVRSTEKANALPMVYDDEVIMKPMERIAPILEDQPNDVKFLVASREIQSRLPEKFKDSRFSFSNPSDGKPTFRANEKGEMEYHVNVTSEGLIDSGRYSLVYKVQSLVSHSGDPKIVARLGSPRVIDRRSHEDQTLEARDLLHHLKRTESLNFNWILLSAEQLKSVSVRAAR